MMMNPRKSWFVVKRLRDSYHSELFTLSPRAFSKVNPVISPVSADSLRATILFLSLCFISCIYGCHVQNELYFQCFVLFFFLNKMMILAHGRNKVCVWSLYLLKTFSKFELNVGALRVFHGETQTVSCHQRWWFILKKCRHCMFHIQTQKLTRSKNVFVEG